MVLFALLLLWRQILVGKGKTVKNPDGFCAILQSQSLIGQRDGAFQGTSLPLRWKSVHTSNERLGGRS